MLLKCLERYPLSCSGSQSLCWYFESKMKTTLHVLSTWHDHNSIVKLFVFPEVCHRCSELKFTGHGRWLSVFEKLQLQQATLIAGNVGAQKFRLERLRFQKNFQRYWYWEKSRSCTILTFDPSVYRSVRTSSAIPLLAPLACYLGCHVRVTLMAFLNTRIYFNFFPAWK